MKVKMKRERGSWSAVEANREFFNLPKGLKRLQAWEMVRHRCKRDHRGFTYDPKTGKAVAT